MSNNGSILVVNSGSSSIKFALFALTEAEPRRQRSGAVERIGVDGGRFIVLDNDGAVVTDEKQRVPDHAAALELILGWVDQESSGSQIVAVGHRVVHGGPECDCSTIVTPSLETRLTPLVPLAPLHLPHNLAGIAAVRKHRPTLLQIASFDTAFHHGLPRVSRLTGLPRRYEKEGLRRYGFHGLSCEYVMGEVRRQHGSAAADGRVIVAHLGNGASMTAIHSGGSVETTMGCSTLAGLPMGTRSGDVDPGVLLYLLTRTGMTVDDLQHLLYEDSGLIGISGLTRNMADLLLQQDTFAAVEAVDYFCHHARRHLAGLTASLGGLDRLIFTGGIGANSHEIRARICEPLAYLGIELDGERNRFGDRTISVHTSRVAVEAFKTDEEVVIARHVRTIIETTATQAKEASHG